MREPGKPEGGTDREGEVLCGMFSPDGKTLATGGTDKTVRLWDPFTGRLLLTLRGPTAGVHSLTFDQNGTTLAALAADVHRWQAKSR